MIMVLGALRWLETVYGREDYVILILDTQYALDCIITRSILNLLLCKNMIRKII